MNKLKRYVRRRLRIGLMKWIQLRRQLKIPWIRIICFVLCTMSVLLIVGFWLFPSLVSHKPVDTTQVNYEKFLQSELTAEELQLLHKLHGKKYYIEDFVKLLDDFLHSSTVKPKVDSINNICTSLEKESEDELEKKKMHKNNNKISDDNYDLDNVESFKNAEDEDYDEHDVMIMAKVRKAEEEFITRFINPFFAKVVKRNGTTTTASGGDNNKFTQKNKTTNSTPVTPEDLLEYHYNTAHGELTHLALEAEILTQQQRFAKHEIHSPSYTDPAHLIRRGYGLENTIFVVLLIPPEIISWGLETAMQLQTLKDIIYAEELSWTPSSSPEPFSLFTLSDKRQLWKRLQNKYKPHVTNVPTITIPMCTRTIRSIYNHSRWPIAVRTGMMEYGVHFDETVTGKYKRAYERTTTTTTTSSNPDAKVTTKKAIPEKTFTTELFGYWNPFNDNRAPFVLSCMPPEYISTTSDDSRGFVYKDNIRQRYMDLPPLSITPDRTSSSSGREEHEKQNNAHHIAFASRHVARYITLQLYRGESYVLFIEANQVIAPSWDWRLQLLYTRIIFDDVTSSLHTYNAKYARTQSTETELENHYESEEHSEESEEEEKEEEEENELNVQKNKEEIQEIRAVISSLPVNMTHHVVKCYADHTRTNQSLQAWIEQIQQIQKEQKEQQVNITSLPHVLRFLRRALELHHGTNERNTSHTQKLHFNDEDVETVQSLSWLTSSNPHVSLTESAIIQMIMGDYDELVQRIEQQLFFNFTYSYVAPHIKSSSDMQCSSTTTTTTTTTTSSSSSSSTTLSPTTSTTVIQSSSDASQTLVPVQNVAKHAIQQHLLYTAGPVRVSSLLNSIETAEVYCANVLKRVLAIFANNEHADETSGYSTDTYNVVNAKHKLPERVALQECWVLFAHHDLHQCVMNKLPMESHVSHLTLQTPENKMREQIMRFTANVEGEQGFHDEDYKKNNNNNGDDNRKTGGKSKSDGVESDVNFEHHSSLKLQQNEEHHSELHDNKSNTFNKEKEKVNELFIEWQLSTEMRTSDCLHDMHYFNAPVEELGTYLHLQCKNAQANVNNNYNNNNNNNEEDKNKNVYRARKAAQGNPLQEHVVVGAVAKSAKGKVAQHIHSVNKNKVATHKELNNITDKAKVNAQEVNLASSAFLFAPAEAFFDIPENLQFRHTVLNSLNSKCNTHFTNIKNNFNDDDNSNEDTVQSKKGKRKFLPTHVTHDPNLSVLTDAEDMFLLTHQLRQSGWHIYKSTEPLSFITSNNAIIEESGSNTDAKKNNNTKTQVQNRSNNSSSSDNGISSYVLTSVILQDMQMPSSHMQLLRDNTRSRYVQILKQLEKRK